MEKERWIFIFFLSVVLFNWPFLSIFEESPYRYLFVVWAIVIGVVFFLTTTPKTDDEERGG